MDEKKENLVKLFKGLAILTLIVAVIVLVVMNSDSVGDFFGFIGNVLLFLLMLALAVIPVACVFIFVISPLEKFKIDPQRILLGSLPFWFILGIVFTIGASWIYPGVGTIAEPFICPQGYVLEKTGTYHETGQVDEDGDREAEFSGTVCSDGKKKVSPAQWAYPQVMVLLFTIFGLIMVMAWVIEDALLRGRLPVIWRKAIRSIFGIAVIAIFVFHPPPLSGLARAIQPFFG